jgi:hypothetical protein
VAAPTNSAGACKGRRRGQGLNVRDGRGEVAVYAKPRGLPNGVPRLGPSPPPAAAAAAAAPAAALTAPAAAPAAAPDPTAAPAAASAPAALAAPAFTALEPKLDAAEPDDDAEIASATANFQLPVPRSL